MARWSLGALALVGFALRLAVGVRAAEEVEADGRPDWNHYVQVQTLSEADLRFSEHLYFILSRTSSSDGMEQTTAGASSSSATSTG